MPSAQIDIYNMALSHIGVSKTVATVNENSNEARACNAFYATTRDTCLRDFPWQFATIISTPLALTASPPNLEWVYEYQLPSDCLKVRRVLNGVSRRDIDWTRINYRLAAGKKLWTDMQNAQIEYTQLVTDTTQFPPDFVYMLSFLLAGTIAPRLTAGDPNKLGDRAAKFYEVRREAAQISDLAEQQQDLQRESDSIIVREGPSGFRPYLPPVNPFDVP